MRFSLRVGVTQGTNTNFHQQMVILGYLRSRLVLGTKGNSKIKFAFAFNRYFRFSRHGRLYSARLKPEVTISQRRQHLRRFIAAIFYYGLFKCLRAKCFMTNFQIYSCFYIVAKLSCCETPLRHIIKHTKEKRKEKEPRNINFY